MDKEQQKHLVAVEMALLALGMPPNLKGFYYIKDAVWMLLQSGGHIGNKHKMCIRDRYSILCLH